MNPYGISVALGILLYLTFRAAKAYEGRVFLSYLFLYGVGRFWIEGLRTDQLLLPGTVIPVSQLLSGILVIAAGCLPAVAQGKKKLKERHTW